MVVTRLGILAWNPAEAAVNKVRAPEAAWGVASLSLKFFSAPD